MNITIPLSLNEQTLAPFRAAWNEASADASLIDNALLERCRHVDMQRVPDSLQTHIGKVQAMAELLADSNWLLDDDTRAALGGALLYFDKSDDLIADETPRFGLLDDAIIIELALTEHREVWAAWNDYRAFCTRHAAQGAVTPADWKILSEATSRARAVSFVSNHYARSDQRSRYQMLDALPRIDLN